MSSISRVTIQTSHVTESSRDQSQESTPFDLQIRIEAYRDRQPIPDLAPLSPPPPAAIPMQYAQTTEPDLFPFFPVFSAAAAAPMQYAQIIAPFPNRPLFPAPPTAAVVPVQNVMESASKKRTSNKQTGSCVKRLHKDDPLSTNALNQPSQINSDMPAENTNLTAAKITSWTKEQTARLQEFCDQNKDHRGCISRNAWQIIAGELNHPLASCRKLAYQKKFLKMMSNTNLTAAENHSIVRLTEEQTARLQEFCDQNKDHRGCISRDAWQIIAGELNLSPAACFQHATEKKFLGKYTPWTQAQITRLEEFCAQAKAYHGVVPQDAWSTIAEELNRPLGSCKTLASTKGFLKK